MAEDRGESDREQVEAQRSHEDARERRELDMAGGKVAGAQRAAAKAVQAAEAKEGEAEEMAIGAGLDNTGAPAANGSGNGSGPEAASVSAAKAVQTMLAGREPRAVLIKRICDHNKALATKSELGLKTVCGRAWQKSLHPTHSNARLLWVCAIQFIIHESVLMASYDVASNICARP